MKIQIDIDDALSQSLEKLVRQTGTNKREYIRQLIKGSILTNNLQLKDRLSSEEVKIVKHFTNIDLLQDLQFLGTKNSQLQNRHLNAVILFYGDAAHKLPDEVHLFRMQGDKEWNFSAVTLSILDFCLCHLLPKNLRKKLEGWSHSMTGSDDNTATALMKYLSQLYQAPDYDSISDDVSEEFSNLDAEEPSASEAFDRGTR